MTVQYMVDMLLLALPSANLATRFKPVVHPQMRKELVNFIAKEFPNCKVDSNVVGWLFNQLAG